MRLVTFPDPVEEGRTDHAATAPNRGDQAEVEIPLIFLGSHHQLLEALGAGHDLGRVGASRKPLCVALRARLAPITARPVTPISANSDMSFLPSMGRDRPATRSRASSRVSGNETRPRAEYKKLPLPVRLAPLQAARVLSLASVISSASCYRPSSFILPLPMTYFGVKVCPSVSVTTSVETGSPVR
jgi:hypothetical protein